MEDYDNHQSENRDSDELKSLLNYLIDDVGEEKILREWKNANSIDDFQTVYCFGYGFRGPCRLFNDFIN